MNRLLLYMLIISFLLQSACHTPAGVSGSNSASAVNNTGIKTGSSILSVILNAQLSGKDVAFEIGQVSVKEGTYKRGMNNSNPSWYKACFTDNAGKVLDSCMFQNPLASRMESIKDDGKLATGTNNKTTGAVYIRTKYSSSITQLYVYDGNNKKLNTFNLQSFLK